MLKNADQKKKQQTSSEKDYLKVLQKNENIKTPKNPQEWL